MRQIIDAFAEYERALIRARTRAAMAAAKRRGQRVGWIPYGMRLASDGRLLEVDANEQAVLREMRWLRLRGATMAGIAETLNVRGIPTRHGRPWQRSAIQQLLERHPAKTHDRDVQPARPIFIGTAR